MQRQAQHESPIRHSEKFGPLKHVNVNRRHRNGQRKEAPTGSSPCRSVEEAKRAQEFEHAAHQHGGTRPGDVGRHDAHFQVLDCEVRDAADQKPKEHDGKADELSAGNAASATEFESDANSKSTEG